MLFYRIVNICLDLSIDYPYFQMNGQTGILRCDST